MKGSAWRISTYSCLAAAILFIAFGSASADTLLGKATLLRADGKTDVYPVVSGKKIAYTDKALIRLAGATFVAEEGSVLEVVDQGGNLDVDIEKGVIHFRIQPHKAVISFVTKDGSFDTPRVVTASASVIEGTITVNKEGTTVELADGSVSVLTTDGLKTINAGEGIVLAQSDPGAEEPAVETEDVVIDTPSEDDKPEETGATGAEGEGSPYTAAAVMGTATAGAVTGVIIGVTTGNNGGDSVASPIE
jgi:hypothetical protein